MQILYGLLGIAAFLLMAFLMSNNKKAINLKTVIVGLVLQFLLALFILKCEIGQKIFDLISAFLIKILAFATEGANFVLGPLTNSPDFWTEHFGEKAFMFAFQLIPALIFMMILVNILYYYGIMQKVIAFLSKIVNKLMDVSGAEAFSNVASSFIGQVSAQITIKPFLPNLTRSEILASMTGSMACMSVGLIAVYAGLGIPVKYMLAACLMAAPGALVISKIIYPETMVPQTMENFKLKKRRTDVNVLDAISKGASGGMKIGLNIVAMLIALIALIALLDWFLGLFGLFLSHYCHVDLSCIGIDLNTLSIKMIFGKIFSVFALLMGVDLSQITEVGALLGSKFVLNEAIAFTDLVKVQDLLSEKSYVIAVFALSGFANISSVAIQISGIGEIAPNQRKNLARMGVRALIGGTITSYISACMAGMLI